MPSSSAATPWVRIQLASLVVNSGLNSDLLSSLFVASIEKSNDPIVLFHTYRIILAAGLSQWTNFGTDDILGLLNLVLYAGLAHTQEMPAYVLNQAATVYAAFTKRAWMNWVAPDVETTPELAEVKKRTQSDLAMLFQSETPLADTSADPQSEVGQSSIRKQKLFGLALIEALVSEFECTRKASSMDMGVESHSECFTRFEAEELGEMFVLVASLLMFLHPENDPVTLGLFTRSLQLFTSILTWPFGQIWQILGMHFIHTPTSAPCRPPAHWRNLLITPNMEILSIYSTMYSFARESDPQLAHVVCEGLMQLANLQGEIFGGQEETRGETRRIWVSSFSTLLMSLLAIEGLSNVEMRDIATITQRFFASTPLSNLIEATSAEGAEQFLTSVTVRTEETMHRLAVAATPGGSLLSGVDAADHFEDDEVEDTVIGEALDIWLSAWATWSSDVTQTTPFAPLQPLMFRVFSSYVMARLEIAKAELNKDQGAWIEMEVPKSKQDLSNPIITEQLTNATAIGRMSPRTSCEFLKSTLQTIATSLRTCVETSDLSSAAEANLEELHWVVMITCHFLCLINRGELASVPVAINRLCHTLDEQGEANQIIELNNVVFEIVTLETYALELSATSGVLVWSPLVAETLAWFMAHWVSCYLLLSETNVVSMCASLQAEYGQTSAAAHGILDSLLRKIIVNLTSWNGETLVLVRSCDILNHISRLDTLNMGLLVKLSGWNDLFTAWTSGDALMAQFPPKVQRRLMEALAHIVQADGVEDQLSYLNALVAPIDQHFSETLEAPNFTSTFQTPATMLSLQVSLERIRGLYKSTRGRTYKSVNAIAVRYLSTLVDLLILYKDHHSMILLILKILNDYSSFVLACTYDEANMVEFHQAISTLFVQAVPTGLFKRKTSRVGVTQLGSRYGEEDARQEQMEELLQALRILSNIVDNEGEEPARLSFEGLAVIVGPNLDEELLSYPVLCKQYFHFVTAIFGCHAGHLRKMEDSLFESILRALQTGLHQTDDYIQIAALDAVAKIASYNYKMIAQKNVDVLDTKRPILGMWIDVLLRWILYDDGFKPDIIMASSLTFFALLLSENEAYNATVANIIAERQNPAEQEQLSNLFNSLLVDVEPTWNNSTKTKFFENFKRFVPTARGILHRR